MWERDCECGRESVSVGESVCGGERLWVWGRECECGGRGGGVRGRKRERERGSEREREKVQPSLLASYLDAKSENKEIKFFHY